MKIVLRSAVIALLSVGLVFAQAGTGSSGDRKSSTKGAAVSGGEDLPKESSKAPSNSTKGHKGGKKGHKGGKTGNANTNASGKRHSGAK